LQGETPLERTFRVADIGGSKITVADVTNLKVVKEMTYGKPEEAMGVVDLISRDFPPICSGVGVACAGVIVNDDKVEVSPNYQALNGFRLGHHLREHTKFPAFVLNDMHAAVLGVRSLRPDDKDFILINLGTGLNAWFVKNGEIVSQAESGHMVIMNTLDAPICTCGRLRHYPRGHAEAYLNGSHLNSEIRQALKRETGKTFPENENVFKLLDKCFDNGETWAESFYYEEIVNPLAAFLVNLVTLLRPKRIFWRGTLAFEALPRIEDYIRMRMQSFLIEPIWAKREILPFEMTPARKQDALIGAASYVESKPQTA
jgi:predicted NBD/HSP70 family sugar kinase